MTSRLAKWQRGRLERVEKGQMHLLNEDAEIESRIKKAKSSMGASKHFFDKKDVNHRVKAQIYNAAPPKCTSMGL
jgi:hypothetical protein